LLSPAAGCVAVVEAHDQALLILVADCMMPHICGEPPLGRQREQEPVEECRHEAREVVLAATLVTQPLLAVVAAVGWSVPAVGHGVAWERLQPVGGVARELGTQDKGTVP
jgi:hypothetical protein